MLLYIVIGYSDYPGHEGLVVCTWANSPRTLEGIMKRTISMILTLALLTILGVSAFGCSAAETASTNVSTAADNFEINRRVVFFNGITDKYLLVIEGRSSIKADTADNQLEVTVKTGPNEYKKHFLGLSDNVTYFVEQLDSAKAEEYHYRVIFKPEVIVPYIELKTSGGK